MKKLLLILFLILCKPVLAGDLFHPGTDFTYDGAFKFSVAGSSNANGAMTYWPNGNGGTGSLIILDGVNVFEITIPVAKKDTYSNLNSASLVQAKTDITAYQGIAADCTGLDTPYGCCTGSGTGCAESLTAPRISGIDYLPQQTGMGEDKLIYSLVNLYSPVTTESLIGWSNLDFTSGLNAAGNWRLSDPPPEAYGNYIFHIDQDWADANLDGKSIGVGRMRWYSIGSSYGPSVMVFAPWSECGGDPVDCEANPPADQTIMDNDRILYWDALSTSLDKSKILNDLGRREAWNFSDAKWMKYGTKQALVFAATRSGRTLVKNDEYYGPPSIDGQGSKGYQGEAYWGELVFFDPDDLIAPPNGNLYEIQPYVRFPTVAWEFNPYTPPITSSADYQSPAITAIAFDNIHGKLYISERNAYSPISKLGVVHVFSVSSGASTADTTSPTDPSNFTLSSTSKTTTTMQWDASSDEKGDVVYNISINGHSYFVVDGVSITHPNIEYYIAPVTYGVTAWDKELNKSNEVFISVGVDEGGNEPLAMYIPGEYSASTQNFFNNIVPSVIPNVAYSFTPILKSNDTAQTWSLLSGTLPSGLSLDEDTGEISGTTSVTGMVDLALQVTNDNDGSIYVREAQLSVTTTDCDRDNDGYQSDAGGCTGQETLANDFNGNLVPGNPAYSETPTGVVLEGSVLTWEMSSASDFSAYTVYSGTESETYTNETFVGYSNSLDLAGSSDHYFVVVALDHKGLESLPSSEINYLDGDTTDPEVQSVSTNTTGLALTVTLSESCTGNAGFTITPSGGAATLTYASGAGASRVYTISRAIAFGETITWTYTPGDVVDAASNAMEGDTGSVTNTVIEQDTTGPEVQSVSINSAGTQATVALTESCTGNTGFTITTGYGTVTLTYVSGTGASRVYDLSRIVFNTATEGVISWTYTPGNVADTASNAMAGDTGTVTNGSTQEPPVTPGSTVLKSGQCKGCQ